ncbi:unnamed protein product, partial [Fusarium langsethiae]
DNVGGESPVTTGITAGARNSISSQWADQRGSRTARACRCGFGDNVGGESPVTTGVTARSRRNISSQRADQRGSRTARACDCY